MDSSRAARTAGSSCSSASVSASRGHADGFQPDAVELLARSRSAPRRHDDARPRRSDAPSPGRPRRRSRLGAAGRAGRRPRGGRRRADRFERSRGQFSQTGFGRRSRVSVADTERRRHVPYAELGRSPSRLAFRESLSGQNGCTKPAVGLDDAGRSRKSRDRGCRHPHGELGEPGTTGRAERRRDGHVAGLPQRQRVRPAHRRHRSSTTRTAAIRGAPNAPCGPASCRWLLLRRPAGARRAASRPSSSPGVQINGTLDLAGGTVEPYVELKSCRFEKEVLLPEAHFTTAAAGGLLGAAAGGGPGAHRGRSAPAALPLPQRRPAHRRADRHGSAAQPGHRLPGPARALDRRRTA